MRNTRATAVLLCLCSLWFWTGCQSGGKAQGKLQIFYSGNLRGSYKPCGCHTPKGGLARWAAYINRHSNPDAAWLIVDAGNFVDRQGGGGCSKTCQFMVNSYRDLHYNVLNLGKQEIGLGYETLSAMIDSARTVEFVSANLVSADKQKPLAKPYVVRDFGKFRVGVIGLLNEADFPKGTTLLDTTHLSVLPSLQTAKRYVPSLAKTVDAVVLLCELPSVAIDTLLKTVPGIDLVISTGGLRNGETMVANGKTRIVGSGSSGYAGHYAMLEFNPAWKDSIAISASQDMLVDTYDEKGEWADRLAAFNAQPPGAGITASKPTR